VISNPELAETLAREGRQRFSDSLDADERDALLVSALFGRHRISRAREETFYYFDHHPGGRFTERVSTLTGLYPLPALPNP
jgi:hypothetical protein